MGLDFYPNSSSKSQYPDRRYQKYVFTSLILFLTCLFLKTLLDLNILLSTGRMISTQDWLDVMFYQKEQIALNSPLSPQRVIILSGSNGLFGLSAQTIAQETGLTAINLASNAALGGEYILNRSEKFIRKGDIILLPLEYELYSLSGISDDFKNQAILNRFMISYDRSSLREISLPSIVNVLISNAFIGNAKKEYMSYFQGHLNKNDILERLHQDYLDGKCHSGYTLNKYGDETCNLVPKDAPVDPIVIKTAMPKSLTDIDPGGYIQRFVEFATNKGAKIVPLYPVSTYTNDYQDLAFDKSAQKIKKYWQDLGINFQDSLQESLLPPNMMFNTHYHPNNIGKEKRTKSVLRQIESQLKGS